MLNTSIPSNPHAPANLLSILERLNTFPTEQVELNTWWIPELGSKPKSSSNRKSNSDGQDDIDDKESDEENDTKDGQDDDDWRKFFDEPATTSTSSSSAGPKTRLHKLTVHQSLHSLPSHRAVFTRAWLTLLPALKFSGSSLVSPDGGEGGSIGTSGRGADVDDSKEEMRKLTVRALNVMHRGVMPHLTRAVLVMDWVAGCVDFGERSCLLWCIGMILTDG